MPNGAGLTSSRKLCLHDLHGISENLRLYAVFLLVVLHLPLSQGTVSYDAFSQPYVLAFGGAYAYVPANTLGAFAMAADLGTDFIQLTVQMTNDSGLVTLMLNEMSILTDVTSRSEYSDRVRTKDTPYGTVTGYFTEDFTLAEVTGLKVRSNSSAYDRVFGVPSFSDVLSLISSSSNDVGLVINVQSSTYFDAYGLDLDQAVWDELTAAGLPTDNLPVIVQAFDSTPLRFFHDMKAWKGSGPAVMQMVNSSFDATDSSAFSTIAVYSDAIGASKNLILQVSTDSSGTLTNTSTGFVELATSAGLSTFIWMFTTGRTATTSFGQSAEEELLMFFATGVTGIITVWPDVATFAKDAYLSINSSSESSSTSSTTTSTTSSTTPVTSGDGGLKVFFGLILAVIVGFAIGIPAYFCLQRRSEAPSPGGAEGKRNEVTRRYEDMQRSLMASKGAPDYERTLERSSSATAGLYIPPAGPVRPSSSLRPSSGLNRPRSEPYPEPTGSVPIDGRMSENSMHAGTALSRVIERRERERANSAIDQIFGGPGSRVPESQTSHSYDARRSFQHDIDRNIESSVSFSQRYPDLPPDIVRPVPVSGSSILRNQSPY